MVEAGSSVLQPLLTHATTTQFDNIEEGDEAFGLVTDHQTTSPGQQCGPGLWCPGRSVYGHWKDKKKKWVRESQIDSSVRRNTAQLQSFHTETHTIPLSGDQHWSIASVPPFQFDTKTAEGDRLARHIKTRSYESGRAEPASQFRQQLARRAPLGIMKVWAQPSELHTPPPAACLTPRCSL